MKTNEIPKTIFDEMTDSDTIEQSTENNGVSRLVAPLKSHPGLWLLLRFYGRGPSLAILCLYDSEKEVKNHDSNRELLSLAVYVAESEEELARKDQHSCVSSLGFNDLTRKREDRVFSLRGAPIVVAAQIMLRANELATTD